MPSIAILRSSEALRAWRGVGVRARLALVPTMGALHAGHLSLIGIARASAERVAASLFVNPAQFAPHEDFDAYPRDEQRDFALLEEAGCDAVYAPSAEAIYPPGFDTRVSVGAVAAPLEGVFRPDHFAGVATIVAKLLIQAGPDVAVFGEKDWQQLQVVRRLVRDLDLPVEILGAPIVREADGLALSSRNLYLNPAERAAAPVLHAALAEAAESIAAGHDIEVAESAARDRVTAAGFASIDYLEVRDSADLTRPPPGPLAGAGRILAAARLGRTRLIDNLGVTRLPAREGV